MNSIKSDELERAKDFVSGFLASVERSKRIRPQFIQCGSCDCYHPADYYGDCRDDSKRFDMDELDTKFGSNGWVEVEDTEAL